jgi:hypothetical protein
MARPRSHASRKELAASTAIIAFAVVLLIYSVAFAMFLNYSRAPANTRSDAPNLDAWAGGQLTEWLRTPGWATVNGVQVPWAQSPDQLTLFGLAVAGEPGVIDVTKLAKLNANGLYASANGLLDYEEAKNGTDLGTKGFHLRTQLAASSNTTGQRYGGVPVAYIANTTWTTSAEVSGLVNYSHAVNTTGGVSTIRDMGNFVYINITVRNNGTTNTSFQVEVRIPLLEAPLVLRANTPVLHIYNGAGNPVCTNYGVTPPYSLCQPLAQVVTPAVWTPGMHTCTPGIGGTNPCPDGRCTANCPETYTVSFKVNKTEDWKWAEPHGAPDNRAYVSIYDPHKKVGEFTLNFSRVLEGPPADPLGAWTWTDIEMDDCNPQPPCLSGGLAPVAIASRIDQVFVPRDERAVIGFDMINATGARLLNQPVSITIRGANNNTLMASWSGTTGLDNRYVVPVLEPGGYTVLVANVSSPSINQTDLFNVTDERADAGPLAQEFLSLHVSQGSGTTFNHHATSPRGNSSVIALDEIAMLRTLIESVTVFADSKGSQQNYSSTLAPPSVLDLANALNTNAYGVVIVGSGAQQGAFNSAVVRDAFANFTTAGGLLLILGSNESYVTWPDALTNATSRHNLTSVQPDPPTATRHALLTQPYVLDYANWAKPPGTWWFRTSSDASRWVTALDKDDLSTHPVLALNKTGTVGLGMIIVTTVQPGMIESPQNQSEHGKFWTNMLGYYLAPLFVDFGPPVPTSATVGVTSRVAATNFGPTKPLLRVDVFVFE